MEEHRLRVFQNQMLRRILGPKRDEVTGGWSKPLSEELHNLYSSSSKIRMINSRRMKWTGHVAHIGKKRCECRILVGKSGGKRQLQIPRHSWKVKIKMDPREIEWGGVDWTDLA
jgi:hypothetical protein